MICPCISNYGYMYMVHTHNTLSLNVSQQKNWLCFFLYDARILKCRRKLLNEYWIIQHMWHNHCPNCKHDISCEHMFTPCRAMLIFTYKIIHILYVIAHSTHNNKNKLPTTSNHLWMNWMLLLNVAQTQPLCLYTSSIAAITTTHSSPTFAGNFI